MTKELNNSYLVAVDYFAYAISKVFNKLSFCVLESFCCFVLSLVFSIFRELYLLRFSIAHSKLANFHTFLINFFSKSGTQNAAPVVTGMFSSLATYFPTHNAQDSYSRISCLNAGAVHFLS